MESKIELHNKLSRIRLFSDQANRIFELSEFMDMELLYVHAHLHHVLLQLKLSHEKSDPEIAVCDSFEQLVNWFEKTIAPNKTIVQQLNMFDTIRQRYIQHFDFNGYNEIVNATPFEDRYGYLIQLHKNPEIAKTRIGLPMFRFQLIFRDVITQLCELWGEAVKMQ